MSVSSSSFNSLLIPLSLSSSANSSKKDTASVQASTCSLPPTSASPSSGRPSHPLPSTLDVAPSSRVPLSLSSTCFSPGTTKAALSAMPSGASVSPQRHEFNLDRCHLRRHRILARFPNRDSRQEQPLPRPAWYLPHQTLIHLEHAYHVAVSSHFQRVHRITNVGNSFRQQPLRQDSWCMGGA